MPEWIPIVFSSWRDDPIPALRDGIAAALAETFGERAPTPPPDARLDELLASWIDDLDELVDPEADQRRIRLLIVLDQFEEYFLYHGDEEGEGTIAVELPRAVNREGLRANFAISIREDAYARLDRFKGRIPNLFDSYFRIRQLGHEAARRAVTLPIEVYNERLPDDEVPFEIEPELVAAVLEQVKTGTVVLGQAGGGTVDDSSETRIEAPFLQLVMRRLWHDARARDDRKLTRGRLQELGGADSIVGAHLREAMEALGPGERDIAAPVFHQLVTPSGAKIAHTLVDLADYAEVIPEQLLPILEKLARTRILRPVDPPPGDTAPRFEIFHDVLAAAVLDWRAVHVREREEAERRRADRRRLRARLITALGGIFFLGILLAAWALLQRHNAQRAVANEMSLSLAAASTAEGDSHADVALLLGFEAYRMSPRAEARSSVMAALVSIRSSGVSAILRGYRGVPSVAFSPDGGTLAFVAADRTVRLWNVRTHRLGRPLRGHTARVLSVAFSPDGHTLASADEAGTVRLWDVRGPTPLGQPVDGGTGPVSSVAFSPDGGTLAYAGADGTVRLWDVHARKQLGPPLHGHMGFVSSVDFSPDGGTLASAGADGTVRLWSVRARKQLGLPLRGHDGLVSSVAFSPDGDTIASAGADATVQLWDVRARTPLGQPVDGGTGPVSSVAFSPDGDTLAYAGDDRIVRLWDVRGRQQLARSLEGHTDRIDSVAFSPDGESLASSGEDGTVRLWDLRAPFGKPLLGHTGLVASVAFSPTAGTLASGGADGTIRLWDVRGGTALGRPIEGGSGPVYNVAFSPDGRLLASAGEDGSVALWDVRTRKLVGRLPGHAEVVYSVAFGPDGNVLASAGADETVRLWDVRRRAPLGRPLQVGRAVFSVAFSPDGASLASADEGGTVRLWDVPGRKQLGLPLRGHKGFVASVGFSPEGDTLASAGADGTVRLWDVSRTKKLAQAVQGGVGVVLSVAFSPDGTTLAFGGDDGSVRLWDVRASALLGEPLMGHTDRVQSVAFSPDGLTIASAGADATVRLWDGIFWRDPDDLQNQVCNLVVGNLTPSEWSEVVPDEDYRPSCAP